MIKKITLIIEKNNKLLGNRGKIVQVNRGYAFNYLIPQKIAKIATAKTIKHYQMLETINKNKQEEYTKKTNIINNNLTELSKIYLIKKSGDTYQIFGSINEKDIINKIQQNTGFLIDKKYIHYDPIKSIGHYILNINLFKDTTSNLKLHIIPENI